MILLLVGTYPFRSQDQGIELLGQEVTNEQQANFIVTPLLLFGIHLTQGFLELFEDG
jgi:hypothetical protein